jgi:hypothetical protein
MIRFISEKKEGYLAKHRFMRASERVYLDACKNPKHTNPNCCPCNNYAEQKYLLRKRGYLPVAVTKEGVELYYNSTENKLVEAQYIFKENF